MVNGDTSRTETTTHTANNGALLARTVFTTSANGRTQTSVSDLDGDTDTDRTDASVITVNADGSTNSVMTVNNGDGSLRSRVTVAQSANSLSKTTTVDVNGDAVIDLTTTDVMVINADTSRVQTVSEFNTDGTLRDRMTTTIGADRVSKTGDRGQRRQWHNGRKPCRDGQWLQHPHGHKLQFQRRWLAHRQINRHHLGQWTVHHHDV